jgi:hypothetical protein
MRTWPGKSVVLLFGLDDEISTQAVRAFALAFPVVPCFLVVIPEGDLRLLLAVAVAVALHPPSLFLLRPTPKPVK